MFINSLKFNKYDTIFVIIITVVWLVIQFLFYNYYFSNGLQIQGGDAGRYLQLADDILSHNELKGKVLGYLGYGLIIAVIKYFLISEQLTIYFLIYFQIGISFFLLCNKYLNLKTAILIFALYMCYPPLQMWNFFVLTDSLFLNLTVIYISIFLINYKKYNFIYFIITSIIIATVRPHGWLLPLSVCIFFLINLKDTKKIIFLSSFFLLIIFFCFFCINNILKLESNSNIGSFFYEGKLMWSPLTCAETDKSIVKYYCIKLEGDNESKYAKLADSYGHLYSMFLMIIQNPFYSIKLFFWRVFWELFKVRFSYNSFVNYGFIITLVPIYIFMLFGIIKKSLYNHVDYFFLIYTFLTLSSIALTFADFSSRFSLVLLPITFYFFSIGVMSLKNSLGKKIKKLAL